MSSVSIYIERESVYTMFTMNSLRIRQFTREGDEVDGFVRADER